MAAGRINLFGLDREALAEVVGRYGAPAFHGKQIFRWLHGRRVWDPEQWTDLPRGLRRGLADDCAVEPGRLGPRTSAADGTVKYRTDLAGGGSVESVYMEQAGRVTLCISSQVGCALDCRFCLTGKMGFERHLDAGEILGQVALIERDRELAGRPFNVVFMGMGEPLHNYAGVLAAFRVLCDPEGFGLSRRRVTISTAGLVPGIERLAREPRRPRLAVSLNATTDAVRDRIMPVNRKYPLGRLLEACRTFARAAGDRFTFEYVLLEGINDGLDDAERLAALTRGLPVKVNLIPFNAVEGWLEFRPPADGRIHALRDRLLELGVPTSIRWSRGAEARAACGQLALLPADGANDDAPARTEGR
jgi:23S rRNA (adenine2503-C2)-methyltransferase